MHLKSRSTGRPQTCKPAGLAHGGAHAGGRSITQKIGQTFSTQALEQRWRKDQILEACLNLVPFRGELVGIDALSRTLFGKAAHGLDKRESAVASALVRAPNARAAQVAQRACGVLKLMQPGSTLKPFLYAQAIAEQRMNHLHQTEPSRAPASPPGVVQGRVAFGDSLEVRGAGVRKAGAATPFGRKD